MSKFFKTLRLLINSTPGRGLTSCAMLFSSFLAFMSAFPTVEGYIREGRLKGTSSLLFGTALALLWGGNLGMASYLGIVGVTTILIGELTNRGISVPRTMLFSGGFALLFCIIAGAYVNFAYAISPLDFLANKVDVTFTILSKTYPEFLKNTLVESGMTQKELSNFVAIKLPGIMVAAWILFQFINVLFASRFNYRTNGFFREENLSKFRISDFMIIPTLIFGGLYIYSVSSYNESKLLEATAFMLFSTFISAYFLQGLLVSYLFIKGVFSSIFWAVMFVIFLAATGYVFMASVGFFDTWFNFRKYFLNKDKKGEEL